MSHTLHRQGTKEALQHDFIVLSRATRGINYDGSKEKLRDFVKLAFKHNPVNLGSRKTGMLLKTAEADMVERTKDGTSSNAVFASMEDACGFIKDLQKDDFDLSVVCTGNEDAVRQICDECGLKFHSANFSLGVYGRTDLLPRPEILEITTMCGHHLLSPYLVEDVAAKIKRGVLPLDKGAEMLVYPCVCACVNLERVKECLRKIIEE